MSAPAGGGGGGGRSFPVYIDLITRGADQAIAGLKGASTALGTLQTGAAGASKAVSNIDTSMTNLSGSAATSAKGVESLSRSAQGAQAGMRTLGDAADYTARGVQTGHTQINQFNTVAATATSTGNALANTMKETGDSMTKAGKGSSAFTTGLRAFRESGRGAQFALIGLSGSINEAVFMIQSFGEAQTKVNVAQAEVNRLQAEGKENTAEYTHAMHDLQDAQRGANFTFRIMLQSILDNITFSGMLLSQLPKVIAKYRELRGAATGVGTAMGQQAGIVQRLRQFFTGLTQSASGLASPLKSAETAIKGMGTQAASAGGALVGAAGQTRAFAGAATPVASTAATAATAIKNMGTTATQAGGAIIGTAGSIGRISPALAAMSASAAGAAASTVPLAAGMKIVDTTSKSLIPGNVRMAESTAAMIPANIGAAGSFGVLGTAMKNFGRTSLAFIMTPIGMILTAIAGLVTYIIALRENWGGAADTARNFSNTLREQADQMGILAGWTKAYADMNDALLDSIGAQTSAQKEASQAADEAKKKQDELTAKVQEASAAVLNLGVSWETTADNILSFLNDVAGAQKQYTDSFVAAQDEVKRRLAENPADEAAKKLEQTLSTMGSRIAGAMLEVKGILNDTSRTWEDRINSMTSIAGTLPVVLEQLPDFIEQPMQDAMDAIDVALEKGTISVSDFGEIVTAVINGQTVPHLEKLSQSAGENLTKVSNYIKDNGSNFMAQATAAGVWGQLTGNALTTVSEDASETGDAVTTAIDEMNQGWEESAAKLQPLLQDMGAWLITLGGTPQRMAAVNDGLTEGIQVMSEYRDGWFQAGITAAYLKGELQSAGGGIQEVNRYLAMTVPQQKQFAEDNAGLADSLGKTAEQTDSLSEAEKERLATLQQEAAAVGYVVEVNKANADSVKYVTDALTGLNAESKAHLTDNQTIIDQLTKQGTAFDENAVKIAAQAEGMQKLHDVQAQAYFDIVETATALGYQGDASKASAQAMLEYSAAHEQAVEVNKQGVETFFQLSDAAKQMIDDFGATSQHLTQVALGIQDLTDKEALAIELASAWDEAQATNVEGMKQLIENGSTVAQVIDLSNEAITNQVNALKNSEKGYKASAKEVQTWAESMAELEPIMLGLANSLGIVDIANQNLTPGMKRTADYVMDLNKQLVSAEDKARAFAIAQGVDIPTAMDASGASLVDMIAGLTDLEDTEKSAAEAAKEASKATEDALQKSFDDITASQDEFSSNMSSAMSKMGEELGKEMEVGLSDIKKKVAKGSQAFGEQFAKEIFPEDFLATAIIEGNDPDDIVKELKDLMHDVTDKELITKGEAKEIFNPIIDFMKKDLPEDTDQAFGYMIGRLPHLMDEIEPVIVNGIQVAGGGARQALKTDLVDPFIEGLSAIPEGVSGIEFGRTLIEDVQNIMPQLQQEFPKIAGLMQQTLDNTSLTADQKVQEIIGYLGQISPAFKEQIMQIDKDGDGFADIMDDKILTPVGEVKQGILEALQVLYEGLAEAGQAGAGIVLEHITTALDDMKNAASDASGPVDGVTNALDRSATAAGLATTPMGDYMSWFKDAPPDIQAAARELYNNATASGKAGRAAGEATEPMNSLDEAVASVGWNAGQADEGTQGLNNQIATLETNAANAKEELIQMVNAIGNLTTKERLGDVEYLSSGKNIGQGVDTPYDPDIDAPVTPQEAGAAAPATDPGAMIDPYVSKLQELSDKAQEVIPQIETLWTNHFTNTSAQLATFVSGPLTTLAQAYTLYQTNVVPILQAMELAWTMHLTNNTTQITEFISGPLTLLAQAYMLYQTNVVPILQAMELAWTIHLANNTTQITEFIAGPLTLLSQAYLLYQTNVIPILQGMELAWTMHLANNTTQITDFIAGPMTLLSEAYVLFQASVVPIIQAMELAWTMHLSNNTTQITEFVGGPVNGYAVAVVALAGSIHAALETANQHWAAHADHVGNMAGAAASHVEQMGRKIVATMNKISAAMGQAEAAAHRLANAIDALHDKEITVTTHFKTTGAAPQAAGMNKTVNSPQLLLVGEKGPEHVKITPLSGASTTSNGIAPGRSGIVAAAKGLDTIVHDKLDAQAIQNFAGERGSRLDDFKESEEGKQIDVEVRKVYKSGWIDKDDWKDFAKQYGYRISDFDKKKNGKLADIMFKRMKNTKFQELDEDFGDAGETSRKKIDWGNIRGRTMNMDEGGMEGPDTGGVGVGVGGGGGGVVTSGGVRAKGGGGGGSTGGGKGFNTRNDGTVAVYLTADFHIDVDKREWIKMQRDLELSGYMATK